MNFIALHKAFENWVESNELGAGAQLLWYKLVAIANASGWPDDLSPSNTTLNAKTRSSEKTLINNRNQLIQAGLITYKSRGKKAGKYTIKDLTSMYSTVKIPVETTVKHTVKGSVDPTVKPSVDHSAYIDKTKQDKTRHRSSSENGACAYWLNQVNPTEAPTILESIQFWVDDFDGQDEIVILAIDTMLQNNARAYSYLNKVLKSWESDKLDTPEKVKKHLAGGFRKNQSKLENTGSDEYDNLF